MADHYSMNETEHLPQITHHAFKCSSCRRTFLALPKSSGKPCPLCQMGKLENLTSGIPLINPEKVLPFEVNKARLQSLYTNFVKGVWIKPTDFKPENLLSRTIPVYWPLWLIDCDILGNWQMEAGFDYQVQSAKEAMVNGQWKSIKEIKGRIRWEARLGELATRVENIAVPALEEHQNRMSMTGTYPSERAEPFEPGQIGEALMEAPDIATEKAWETARPLVDNKIDNVCQEASGAQHSKKFTLHADYQNPNWTQLYLPMLATYYLDDKSQPQILIVNGQTGQINGPRLASPKRGLKIAGFIGIAAAALFLIALLVFLLSLAIPEVRAGITLFIVLSIGTGLIALIPALWPAIWNRQQEGPRIIDRRRKN